LIREEFARGHSIFFCLPTTEDILSAKLLLEKGIENYTFVLHSGLKKEEILQSWKKIVDEDHPVLVIATGSYISIPRDDFGTIILDKESSRSYKIQTRPYIDLRTAIELIARALGIRLVLGDMLLRIETLWEEKEGKYSSLSPLKFRSTSRAEVEIVQMKIPEDKDKKHFTILSEKLKKLLESNKEKNEHLFLFCSRKGLFPTTVCSDCGRVVSCTNCEAPMVLYTKKNTSDSSTNYFACHHCGERRAAGELCRYCNSWRLNTLGIGVDGTLKEIKNHFPEMNVFIMDSEHIKTHKQAKKVRDEFYNTPGSVLIGTELALTYLNQKVENSAVVSIDSYFSIPDYQINEKIFHILLSIRSETNDKMLIQTRKEDVQIFEYASKGNLLDFWKSEIEDRKATDYPPFAKYIKLSLEGEKNAVRKEMEQVKEFLKPYKVDIYDAFSPGSLKKFTVHGLITVEKRPGNDTELLTKLKSLPQSFSIKVDPITLL
jgi:primosomal protein N' (replication factor Y)